MASPLTVWSSTEDGYVYGQSATYATAASTATDYDNSLSYFRVGQTTGFICYEGFYSWDTSSVGTDSTVTVATVSLYGQANAAWYSWTVEARVKDWGASLTTTDWVAAADLSSLTKVATFVDPATNFVTNGYNAFASESAFLSQIVKTGTTRLLFDSTLHVAQTEPGHASYIVAYTADDNTGGGGTDRDPKLYVEYTEGGSVLTAWSSTADGYARSWNSSYTIARQTAGLVGSTGTSSQIGQAFSSPNYMCYELFTSFDTSSVGAGVTVTVATLSFYMDTDLSITADFTVDARIYNWGGTLEVGDFRSGVPADANSLDEYTLVASRSTTPDWSTSAYSALTSESAFLTNVALTGTTYVILNSSRHLAGDTPTGSENLYLYLADDNTGGGGTDRDPKLYVEYTEGAGFVGMTVRRPVG